MNNYRFRVRDGERMSKAFSISDPKDVWLLKNTLEQGITPEFMLYSPFTDINGVEICQGDRVKITWEINRTIDGHSVIEVIERTGSVVFEKGCFLLVEDGAKVDIDHEEGFWCALTDPIDDGCKVEIIGTVYDSGDEDIGQYESATQMAEAEGLA